MRFPMFCALYLLLTMAVMSCTYHERVTVPTKLKEKELRKQKVIVLTVSAIELLYNQIEIKSTKKEGVMKFGFDPTKNDMIVYCDNDVKKIIPYNVNKSFGPKTLKYIYGESYQLTLATAHDMEQIESKIVAYEAWRFCFNDSNKKESRIYFSRHKKRKFGYKIDIIFVFDNDTVIQKSFDGGPIDSYHEDSAFGQGVAKPFRKGIERGASIF